MTASTHMPAAAEIAAAIKRFAMTGSSDGRDDLRVICIKNAALFAEAPAMLAALRGLCCQIDACRSVGVSIPLFITEKSADAHAILARIDGETK